MNLRISIHVLTGVAVAVIGGGRLLAQTVPAEFVSELSEGRALRVPNCGNSAGNQGLVELVPPVERGSEAVPAHPPLIVIQPQSRSISSWEGVYFEAQANGTPPFSYQWRSNGLPILGATSGRLYVPPLSPLSTNYVGYFDVIVSNAYGAVPSAAARLRVNPLGPGIIGEPEDQFACVGDTVYFWVYDSGGSTPYYQWRHNGFELSGQTRDRLTLSNVSLANVGDYTVVISNRFGTATSDIARLVVDPTEAVIRTQPRSALVDEGNGVVLFVHGFDCAPLSYQWRRNGTNLPGEMDENLVLPAAAAVLILGVVGCRLG